MDNFEKNEIAKKYIEQIDKITDYYSISKRTKIREPLATHTIELIIATIKRYENDTNH